MGYMHAVSVKAYDAHAAAVLPSIVVIFLFFAIIILHSFDIIFIIVCLYLYILKIKTKKIIKKANLKIFSILLTN